MSTTTKTNPLSCRLLAVLGLGKGMGRSKNLQMKRRKEIYLIKHPETRHGGDRKSDQSKRHNGDLIESFSKDTSDKIGKSQRMVERQVQIGKELSGVVVIEKAKNQGARVTP